MRRLVSLLIAITFALPLSSCEQILLSPLKKWGDSIDERREKRLVHPFELFLTTAEPELDYVRFYGESQDIKTTLDPTPQDWFKLSSTTTDAFSFSIERRYAEFTDNTDCTLSISTPPSEYLLSLIPSTILVMLRVESSMGMYWMIASLS